MPRRHLKEASAQYPDAAKEIQVRTAIVEGIRGHNFEEVRQMFKDADSVEGYLIFNIPPELPDAAHCRYPRRSGKRSWRLHDAGVEADSDCDDQAENPHKFRRSFLTVSVHLRDSLLASGQLYRA